MSGDQTAESCTMEIILGLRSPSIYGLLFRNAVLAVLNFAVAQYPLHLIYSLLGTFRLGSFQWRTKIQNSL